MCSYFVTMSKKKVGKKVIRFALGIQSKWDRSFFCKALPRLWVLYIVVI